jgi:hypothetical protein
MRKTADGGPNGRLLKHYEAMSGGLTDHAGIVDDRHRRRGLGDGTLARVIT